MITIIIYEFLLLLFSLAMFLLPSITVLPIWYMDHLTVVQCGLIGLVGGVLYCLRGVYLNKSVYERWDKKWYVWYYLRPFTSLVSGVISYVFLKAGLLVLDASQGETVFGFLAVAFIAGYNVDNFLKKIEDIAQTIWGIDKSRTGQNK